MDTDNCDASAKPKQYGLRTTYERQKLKMWERTLGRGRPFRGAAASEKGRRVCSTTLLYSMMHVAYVAEIWRARRFCSNPWFARLYPFSG